MLGLSLISKLFPSHVIQPLSCTNKNRYLVFSSYSSSVWPQLKAKTARTIFTINDMKVLIDNVLLTYQKKLVLKLIKVLLVYIRI